MISFEQTEKLQQFLFSGSPSRAALLSYDPIRPGKPYKVKVFRNHAFEAVAHTMGAYLDYAGLSVDFDCGGYDDSFSFIQLDPAADLVIIWIDAERYAPGAAAGLMDERLPALRAMYSGPVLLVPFGAEIVSALPGVTSLSLAGIAEKLDEGFTDRRAKSLSGTALSGRAMLELSRELGLRYLPALLRPALKALLVDLDNTLYKGVLGEDGPDVLELTPGHALLQTKLKELAGQGFFLCALSKNDQRDVEELLRLRSDFPLKKEDFTCIKASWGEKSRAAGETAEFLNIGPDSMVFIDDNIGELAAMAAAFPEMKLIRAMEDGAATAAVVESFPGLLRLGSGVDDSKRKADVQANLRRRELKKAMSHEDYVRSLGLCLTFTGDDPAQAARITELANKTNQFIFNYRRYSAAQVDSMLASPDWAVVTVSLSDRLSDSGLIGVCVGRLAGDYVELDECFVSCRALGRGIDDIIVLGAAERILRRFGTDKLRVLFRTGPRNAPAEDFVNKYLPGYLDAPAAFDYTVPDGLLTVTDNNI